MALVESLIGVGGAIAGSAATHFFARFADRSRPQCELVRVSESTTVPTVAETQLARFPDALAARYNSHATLPASIDASKEIPLKQYLKQVQTICELIRLRRSQISHYKSVLSRLFTSLDRNDAAGFAETFSDNNAFLWGYIQGRCRRFTTPPTVPDEVVDHTDITPANSLHVSRDEDGDFFVDVANTVHRVGLIWSNLPSDQKDRCERVASALARDIAELKTQELRTLLGTIEQEVETHLGDLASILNDALAEKRRFSFLSITVLLRNKGKRVFCVNPEARLFVNTNNYSCVFDDGSNSETLKADVALDLVLGDTESNGVIAIEGGSSRTLEFSTTTLFSTVEYGRNRSSVIVIFAEFARSKMFGWGKGWQVAP